jgi:GDPmannose 4,6-dehydratase
MHRMLQQDTPRDYVIATGHTHTLEQFVETAFSQLGLVWQDHVEQREELMRPNELRVSRADPSLAATRLQWRATSDMTQVVSKMLDALGATTPLQ